MIKGISGGAYLNVMGGSSSVPYINTNTSNPMQGMLRIQGSDIQVFDGSTWLNAGGSYATVDLNADTQNILEWARKKMNEERRIEELAKKHPAIFAAAENVRRAEEQLKTTIILSEEQTNTTQYHPV